eukprot:6292336-Prymnesium_polylepis.1
MSKLPSQSGKVEPHRLPLASVERGAVEALGPGGWTLWMTAAPSKIRQGHADGNLSEDPPAFWSAPRAPTRHHRQS